MRTCLQQPANLYADHIGRRGVVEPALWSYNQGSMIGAGTLLYQFTRNSAYLYQARQTATASLAYFTNERLGSEIPFFVSVYFRNLLYLDSVTHDPPGPSIAQNYVNYAWQHLRLSNNMFVFGCAAVGAAAGAGGDRADLRAAVDAAEHLFLRKTVRRARCAPAADACAASRRSRLE